MTVDDELRNEKTGWIVVLVALLIVLGFAGLLMVISTPPAEEPVDTTSTSAMPIVEEPIAELTTVPAVAHLTAVRVDPPDPPPPDPCGLDIVNYVNALPYQAVTWEPMPAVNEAYALVARCIGWDEATIEKWRHFLVEEVIRRESAGCWNIMGGATVGGPCDIGRQGRRTDAGFFQLVREYWYGPGGHLCRGWGICSAGAIIGSPWNSMYWGLIGVMIDGKGPWCYVDKNGNVYHNYCGTVTRYWP